MGVWLLLLLLLLAVGVIVVRTCTNRIVSALQWPAMSVRTPTNVAVEGREPDLDALARAKQRAKDVRMSDAPADIKHRLSQWAATFPVGTADDQIAHDALKVIEQLEKRQRTWTEGGIWLLSDETDLKVLVERSPGQWVEVINVPYPIDGGCAPQGIISHIVEPAGIDRCLLTKKAHWS